MYIYVWIIHRQVLETLLYRVLFTYHSDSFSAYCEYVNIYIYISYVYIKCYVYVNIYIYQIIYNIYARMF